CGWRGGGRARDERARYKGLLVSVRSRLEGARAATAGCRGRAPGVPFSSASPAGTASCAGPARVGGTRGNCRGAVLLPRTPAGGLLWRSILSPLLGLAPALVGIFSSSAA